MSQQISKKNPMPTDRQAPFSVFVAATIVVFFLSLSAADSIGFVPDYIDGTTPNDQVALSSLPQLGVTAQAGVTDATSSSDVVPVHITISSVGIDLPVQDPSTTDVDALDALLGNGPAYYADSATLGEQGTAIIFAHSSHLPIVNNPMFKAFNQVPNVQQGDTVDITGSDGKDYLYSVQSVVKADTNSGTSIDLSPSQGTRLVLVTCDTLTGTSSRFVLTADFIGTD